MEIHEQLENMENPQCSPFKAQSIPSTPLQQMSPERLNQPRVAHSPSLPLNLDLSARRHQHRSSDASEVKARVALINSFSQNGSPTRSTSPSKPISPSKPYHPSSSHAAIQRAVLGREEAESALNSMVAQLESAKARERLVSERVESLMEQLTEARSRQRHERQVYEKEVKSAKKNEYKAELAVIKLQEDLKETRSELDGVKVRAEHDRAEKEKARQEAFERAYAVAGMTEEMQMLQEKLRAVEQERDSAVAAMASRIAMDEVKQAEEAAAQQLKFTEESRETARADEQIMVIEVPVAQEQIQPSIQEAKSNVGASEIEARCAELQREVNHLKRAWGEDQELIHFMNMQCQFKACPCRVAEQNGVRFVHDLEYDQRQRLPNAKKRKIELDSLPKSLSWAQKMQMRKNKQAEKVEIPPAPSQSEIGMEVRTAHTGYSQPSSHETIDEEMTDQATPLPPTHIEVDELQEAEHVAEVEIATQIPLPSPKNTPEHTANLEEITQVIVEPGNLSTPFMFSTSTSSNMKMAEPAPKLYQSQSSVHLPEDFFDLSPPKSILPRPSTALGILTVTSPVRLVPDSPLVVEDESTITGPRVTRIALNDTSPVRQARTQHRPQSRSNIRNQSRGRSPAPQADYETSRPGSALDAASPASTTMFPITPVVKHARSNTQSRPQPPSRNQSQQSQYHVSELSTTISVPLRDECESLTTPTSDSLAIDHATSNQPLSASSLKDPMSHIPGTPITREAALAQIRARRDRARSVNMRKNAEDNLHPDGGERNGAKTPASVARRGIKVDLGNRLGLNGNADRGRDVSHASAPGRF